MKKRIISLLLVVVMVVAMIPVIALPTAATEPENTETNYMAYASSPMHDGKNSNGEYDNTYAIPINSGYWWDGTANATVRTIYSDDAIYILVEAFHAYNANDTMHLFFDIGGSYVGSKGVVRDGNTYQTISNMGGSVDIGHGNYGLDATYFAMYSDDTTFSFEAKFPVEKMNEDDKAAFATGTLEVKVAAAITQQNKTGNVHESVYNTWRNFVYNSTKPTSFDEYELPVLTFAAKDAYEDKSPANITIPYSSTPCALDGQFGAGEYDNALVVPMAMSGTGWWGKAADENDVAYLKYTDDAIYIFINGDNGETEETWDMTGVGIKIGTTYAVTKIIQNHYFGSTLISKGSLSISSENYDSYFATSYPNDATEHKELNLEVRIPFNRLNAADKEALANGTLDIQLGFMNMDDYKANASFSMNSHDIFTVETKAEQYVLADGILTSFKLGEKKPTEINFSGKAPTLDGVNAEGEYDDATVIPLAYAPNGWQKKAPDANDVAYVKYTTDALYVYINGDPGEIGEWDMTAIGFKIGESYIGTNAAQQNSNAPYLFASSDAKATVTEDFFAVGDTIGLEIRFPVDGMTDADKAAFADGTLDIQLGFMNMDEQTYTASFFIAPTSGQQGNYDAFTVENKSSSIILPNLISFKLGENASELEGTIDGASLTLGEDLSLNFIATVDTTSYDVALKITTNNRETVIKGTPVEGEENKYAFAFTGIAPQCMGDIIEAELSVQSKVLDAIEEADEYSVAAYLEEIKDAETEQLINDLLVYGAAAQKYVDYNTDNLVTDLVASVETIENTDRMINEAITGGQFIAAGVHFANTNKLYFKFEVATMEGVVVTINDVDVTDKIEECDEGYVVYTDDIMASEFGNLYIVDLTIGEETQTLEYSVNAYAAAMATGNGAMAELAKALYAYGASVEAYLAPPSNS